MEKQAPTWILSLDFDGTTVDPVGNPPVHGFLVDELRRLRTEGAVWVVNTGRSMEFALEGLRWCGVPFRPDYLITEETCLWHWEEDTWKELGDWNIKRTLACRTMMLSAPGFFENVKTYIKSNTRAQYLEQHHAPHEIISSSEAEMDRICEVIDEYRESHPDAMIHYERATIYLRFAHSDFNKGTTLSELGRVLGLEPDRIFAAGDNYNDLPKLQKAVAHRLACPANAVEAVKQTITDEGGFVAQSSYGKGIAEALRHFFP